MYIDVVNDKYDCDWKDDKKKVIFGTVDKYYGEWKNDKKNGKGI